MASLAELQDALVNADKAGDAEAARALADAIVAMSGAQEAKKPAAPMSRMEKVGFGMADPIHGGAQWLTNLLPSEVVSAGNSLNNWLADKTGLVAKLPEGGVDQQVRERERDYQAARTAAGESGIDGYRALGNVVSPANLALASRIPAAASLAGRVGLGAAGGAASAGLAPVGEGDFSDEKVKQLGVGALAGGAAPLVIGSVARAVSPKASVNPDLALLKAEGVKPTIGQTLGGAFNRAEEKLTSVPIVGDAISAARGRALEQFNNAAINRATAPIGASVKGTGQQAVAEAGDLLSAAYDDALSRIKSVKFDGQFVQDFSQLKKLSQGLTPTMRDKFTATTREIVGSRTSQAGGMTAEAFKKVDSEIGQQAARYRASSVASEQELGDALTQLQSLLKQQVVRSNPDAAKALAAADKGWAHLVRVEGAAKAGKNAEGVFTPGQLNMAIQTADRSTRKRAVARGEALMQDLGSAGQSVLGNKVPNSFTTDRALMAGGGLGAYFLDPLIPAGLLAGGALYTNPAQALLRGAVSARPELAQPVAETIRKSGPLLVPGAAQVGLGLLNY